MRIFLKNNLFSSNSDIFERKSNVAFFFYIFLKLKWLVGGSSKHLKHKWHHLVAFPPNKNLKSSNWKKTPISNPNRPLDHQIDCVVVLYFVVLYLISGGGVWLLRSCFLLCIYHVTDIFCARWTGYCVQALTPVYQGYKTWGCCASKMRRGHEKRPAEVKNQVEFHSLDVEEEESMRS